MSNSTCDTLVRTNRCACCIAGLRCCSCTYLHRCSKHGGKENKSGIIHEWRGFIIFLGRNLSVLSEGEMEEPQRLVTMTTGQAKSRWGVENYLIIPSCPPCQPTSLPPPHTPSPPHPVVHGSDNVTASGVGKEEYGDADVWTSITGGQQRKNNFRKR